MRDGVPLSYVSVGIFAHGVGSETTHIAHTVARDALREAVIEAARNVRDPNGECGGTDEVYDALEALDAHREAS